MVFLWNCDQFSDFPSPTIATVPALRSRSARSRPDQSRRPARPPAGRGRRLEVKSGDPSKVTERASWGDLGPEVTIGSGRPLDGPIVLAALEEVQATIRAGSRDDRVAA
jgi:hypothetical protein